MLLAFFGRPSNFLGVLDYDSWVHGTRSGRRGHLERLAHLLGPSKEWGLQKKTKQSKKKTIKPHKPK